MKKIFNVIKDNIYKPLIFVKEKLSIPLNRVIALGMVSLIFLVFNYYHCWIEMPVKLHYQIQFCFAFFGFWLAYIRMGKTDEQISLTKNHQRANSFNTALQNLKETGKYELRNHGAIRTMIQIAVEDPKGYYKEMIEMVRLFLGQWKEGYWNRADIKYFFDFISQRNDKDSEYYSFFKKIEKLDFKLDLHNVDLRGAYLNGADLSGAYLHHANLTDADLTGANLTGAIGLKKAKLDGAYYWKILPPKLDDDLDLKKLNIVELSKKEYEQKRYDKGLVKI